MKILTIAIPSYNSMDYMRNCIESLLPGGEDVEILIVDDGSKDDTPAIADEYQEKYPGIVRAIHQENGGHGEAVNAGLRNATGFFYKVVDSVVWVDADSYLKILAFLNEAMKEEEALDMLIANYVYEKVGAKHKKVIQYHSILPENRYFGWDEIGHFHASQNILMHSVIYRTELRRSFHFELPKHTFYVDNIFVYNPLPYVKTMYYCDVDLYRYFIGREDQSVNEKVMIGRIDQQIRVTKIMIDAYDLTMIRNRKLRNYMVKYLTMMMTVSSVFLIKEGSEESLKKREELWNYLKTQNKGMYRMVNKMALSTPMQIRSAAGRKIVVWGYSISQKIYGFN